MVLFEPHSLFLFHSFISSHTLHIAALNREHNVYFVVHKIYEFHCLCVTFTSGVLVFNEEKHCAVIQKPKHWITTTTTTANIPNGNKLKYMQSTLCSSTNIKCTRTKFSWQEQFFFWRKWFRAHEVLLLLSPTTTPIHSCILAAMEKNIIIKSS